MAKVLVVVDMQNDFINGVLGTPEARAIVPKVEEKIRSFDGRVRATVDTHREGNYLSTQEGRLLPVPHCIAGTHGWETHADIAETLREELGFSYEFKHTFGSVGLAEELKGYDKYVMHIDEIVLVGLCTDICVISNAMLLKTYLPEAKITVDAACCAGTTPENHKTALQAMKNCQIFIENEEE